MNPILTQPACGYLVLEALLVAAAAIDWRTSRVPNALTFAGAAAAIVLAALPGGIGVTASLLGAACAFALLLPLWMLRITGAGDVKLFAMVGAFIGIPGVLIALLFTSIAGGVFALAYAAVRGKAVQMAAGALDLLHLGALAAMQRQRIGGARATSVGKLPYALCVWVGTSAWLLLQGVQR
jgi:prepilin peptidase CpaA